jgi:hypothetical protein
MRKRSLWLVVALVGLAAATGAGVIAHRSSDTSAHSAASSAAPGASTAHASQGPGSTKAGPTNPVALPSPVEATDLPSLPLLTTAAVESMWKSRWKVPDSAIIGVRDIPAKSTSNRRALAVKFFPYPGGGTISWQVSRAYQDPARLDLLNCGRSGIGTLNGQALSELTGDCLAPALASGELSKVKAWVATVTDFSGRTSYKFFAGYTVVVGGHDKEAHLSIWGGQHKPGVYA